MDELKQLLVFFLDNQRYALNLAVAERVFPAAEITPVPKAPDIVMGVINVQGQVVPVINTRKRFSLPEREINLSDQFIIAHTSRRAVALLADSVSGVVECSPQDVIGAEEILPRLQYVEGVVKLKDQLILIHDLDKCLSLEEERMLGDAIEKA